MNLMHQAVATLPLSNK